MPESRLIRQNKLSSRLLAPVSVVAIGLIAIAAIAVSLYQSNRQGPVAPTAPESQPQALEVSSENNTNTLVFDVVEPTEANLGIRKLVNNSQPEIGTNVTFTIELTNQGPGNATGVIVRDQLPTGMTFVSYTADQGTYNSSTGDWTVGTVAANAVVELRLVARVDNAGALTNTATVTANDLDDPISTNDSGSIVINSTDTSADLDIVKRVNNSTPQVGQDVTFTVEVRNAGPQNATSVSVRDVLGSNLTYQSHNTANGSYDNSTGVWNIGSLNRDAVATLTLVARANSATANNSENYVEIISSSPVDRDSTPNNNSGRQGNASEDDNYTVALNPQSAVTATPTATTTTTPGANGTADLSIIKRVNNSNPAVGEEIVYTIEVYNAGPDTATGVRVLEALASGLSFVAGDPSQGTYNQATGIWDVGTINATAVASLEIRARVNQDGALINAAQITDLDQFDPNTGNDNQDSLTINSDRAGADLSLIKRVNKLDPKVGDNITFTLEVHNAGPNQANDVTVRDLLPQGTTFVSANPSQGSYNSGNGRWTIGSVTRDQTARMEMVVRVDSNAGIRNIAEVMTSSITDPDSSPGNNNPAEDDYDEAVVGPQVGLPKAGSSSRTTMLVIAVGVVVLILGAIGLLLVL